jgi:cell division transport system ATP-binding protein
VQRVRRQAGRVWQLSAIVEFDSVGLRYGTGAEVLRDLDFRLAAGGFYFLTGPSGAGKTSLLKLLYLALRPSRGVIRLFDEDIVTMPRPRLPGFRRRIGVVFQEFRLLDHLTTFENVALPLRVTGERYAKYRDNVMELLDWVGLADHANAYPPVLSGGEKQRVAIARAVIGKPDLLLADEPTGNVDPALAIRLVKLLIELHRFGTTVLIATHDKNLIEQTRAPVLTLERGTVRLPA